MDVYNPTEMAPKNLSGLTPLADGEIEDLAYVILRVLAVGVLDELDGTPERDGPRLLREFTSDHRKFHGQFLRRCYAVARLHVRCAGRDLVSNQVPTSGRP